MPQPMTLLWTARSGNTKTGDVPTAWVGATLEEARQSCLGCPLLDAGCYAHSGSVGMGGLSARKGATRNPDRYTLKSALANRSASARMARFTAIGDIGRIGREMATALRATVQKVGLAVVGYTHHWREAEVADAWKGSLMASTESLEDADEAVGQGWRATVIVSMDAPRTGTTPAGRKLVVCPAQEKPGVVTCNTCRLCDASRPGPVIAFRAHGNQAALAGLRTNARVAA